MDAHIKERLTGALILVALFVIVVPEMLSGPMGRRDGPAAPAADEGPPVRSYSMELGETVPDQSALAPQVETAPAPAAAPVVPEPAASSSPVASPAPVPQSPAAPSPAASPRPPPSAPAPAPAPVARPAPAPVPAGGAWWVQAGSFSQSANAQRVVRELASAGITARVFPVQANGKEMFRVRVGPIADRAAAEAMRERLGKAGHKATLVAP